MTFEKAPGFITGCAIGVVRSGQSIAAKFRIPRNLLDELGWTQETRVSISWGTGEDAGRVLISADSKGYAMGWPGRSRCAYIETTRFPKACQPTESHRLEAMGHEIIPEGLVLELPAFLMPAIERAAE